MFPQCPTCGSAQVTDRVSVAVNLYQECELLSFHLECISNNLVWNSLWLSDRFSGQGCFCTFFGVYRSVYVLELWSSGGDLPTVHINSDAVCAILQLVSLLYSWFMCDSHGAHCVLLQFYLDKNSIV